MNRLILPRWGAFALAMTVLAGCASDSPIAPPTASPTPPAVDTARTANVRAFLISAFDARENACEERTPIRDKNGKFGGWKVKQLRPNIGRAANDTGMVNFQIIRFEKNTRLQTDFIDCVLTGGDSAKQFMKNYFKPKGARSLGGIQSASSVMDDLTCHWDGWSGWNCGGGIYCQKGVNIRAGDGERVALSGRRAMVDETGHFTCTGGGSEGCWINVEDWGEETYFHTWGGTCDEDGEGGDPSGGGGSPSGSGTGEADSNCPNSNPRCLLALSPEQRQKMVDALRMTDTTIAICREAFDAVMDIQAAWRGGNPDIVDIPSKPEAHGHDAQSRAGSNPLLHVDLDYLDTYMNATDLTGLGRLLLHEGWHLAGYANHPNWDSGPTYYTPPFDKAPICIHP